MLIDEQKLLPAKGADGPRCAVGCDSDCRSRDREFDPGLVPYFVEKDHEIISTVLRSPPSADSTRAAIKRKYVHEVLVNH